MPILGGKFSNYYASATPPANPYEGMIYLNTSSGVLFVYGGSHPENRPLRKNYAHIGGVYDAERDAFYDVQPFPSWTLDEETCIWNPPVEYPQDGNAYKWDENTKSWILGE